ncbi:phosphatidate phosphatase APP1 [Mesonia algae]|uniref:Phosphatidate phosphatase APP1 n=1 Tax=Mesonia algae TaxID=213248 RepID=A0A2W7I3J6_9FLAO|nr:phosphatase domain-containing protein [Mesonia algae]PZW41451.1 phosphatidate phosphatase APP1 [Mesonia algae]
MFFNLFKKDPLQIITFQSYGTDKHLYARGRALEDESIDLNKNNWFQLLVNSWKRFETDEIKHTTLNLKLSSLNVYKVKTDTRGYFNIDEPAKGLRSFCNDEGWLSYEVSYDDVDILKKITSQNRFPGEILIPSEKAEYGVISDIDDTILHTGVASFLKFRVLFNTFFKPASSRIPLKGAADFYHKLHRGKTGKAVNPVFYVSHSPWNLYRYLELFLKHNNFPKGPILLRDFSKSFFGKKTPQSKKPQKQHEIVNVFKMYPKLSFILIGDSGEKDGEIYKEIASQFPGRVLAIYLRSINNAKKLELVEKMMHGYNQTPYLLVKDSHEAIVHARENGFIK